MFDHAIFPFRFIYHLFIFSLEIIRHNWVYVVVAVVTLYWTIPVISCAFILTNTHTFKIYWSEKINAMLCWPRCIFNEWMHAWETSNDAFCFIYIWNILKALINTFRCMSTHLSESYEILKARENEEKDMNYK